MKPNRVAQVAAVILAIFGIATLLAAGLIATHQFTVTAGRKHFSCGSVLVPKDPRNKVSDRATVPVRLQRAYKLCQTTSSNRTHTATTFLLVGVVPLLIVLTLPALSRRSRRARSRRRVKF